MRLEVGQGEIASAVRLPDGHCAFRYLFTYV